MKKYYLILFYLIISYNLLSQNLPGYAPTDSLVGWWPFNGNANDESGNGNNGTVNGATLTTDRFGNKNSAYYFNNNQDINCGNSSSLGLTKNSVLTVCYWTSSSNKRWPFIKKYTHAFPGNSNYAFGTNGNTILFTGDGTNVVELPSINDTSWIHICAIFNEPKDSIKLYINGNFVKTGRINFSNNISTSNLIFGPRISEFYPYSDGKLDDIGIWNRALTETEIRKLYEQNCQVSLITSNQSYFKGETATLNVETNITNPIYCWQSDFGQGFVNLMDYGNYSGTNTNTLTIQNLSLRNHAQPFRVIVKNNDDCFYPISSDISTVYLSDTCISFDTLRINVTDTLIIALNVGVNSQIISNIIKVYPNPAKNNLIVDYGNYTSMNGYSINIVNINGIVIFSTQVNTQTSIIDISQWSKGLYFVKIIDKQNNIIDNKKIIIQ